VLSATNSSSSISLSSSSMNNQQETCKQCHNYYTKKIQKNLSFIQFSNIVLIDERIGKVGLYCVPQDLYHQDKLDRKRVTLILLCSLFPEFCWRPWCFPKVNLGFWHSHKHRNSFFDWLTTELNIRDYSDWYKVTYYSLKKISGRLLCIYDDSPSLFVSSFLPDHHWLEWKFARVPNDFWNRFEMRRKYFDWLVHKLDLSCPMEFHRMKVRDVSDNDGSGLLFNHYGSSPMLLVTELFPEIYFDVWDFYSVPRGICRDRNHLCSLFDKVFHLLGIRSSNDWHFVSNEELRKIHPSGATLLRIYGSLHNCLSYVYPTQKWNSREFEMTNAKSSQQTLLRRLKKRFNDQDLQQNFFHSALGIELDFFIKPLALAFEYQGEHHERPVRVFTSSVNQEEIDVSKMKECTLHGITLFAIPFNYANLKSWSKIVDDLISKERRDLSPINELS